MSRSKEIAMEALRRSQFFENDSVKLLAFRLALEEIIDTENTMERENEEEQNG